MSATFVMRSGNDDETITELRRDLDDTQDKSPVLAQFPALIHRWAWQGSRVSRYDPDERLPNEFWSILAEAMSSGRPLIISGLDEANDAALDIASNLAGCPNLDLHLLVEEPTARKLAKNGAGTGDGPW